MISSLRSELPARGERTSRWGAADAAAPFLVGGAASIGVTDVVCGPPRAARVLAALPRAAYLALEAGGPAPASVIAVVDGGAVALPNAVVAPGLAPGEVFGDLSRHAWVGDGRVWVGATPPRGSGTGVAVGRWWDPRPRVAPTGRAPLAAALERLGAAEAPGLDRAGRARVARLEAAAVRGDASEAAVAVAGLVGAGAGLTPAGDDVLAGLLAGLMVLTPALPAADPSAVDRLRTAVGDAALQHAPSRTTAISAALLEHASHGEVAPPVRDLLTAFAGRGDVTAAAEALAMVGATSGRDLLAGAVIALRVLLAAAPGVDRVADSDRSARHDR